MNGRFVLGFHQQMTGITRSQLMFLPACSASQVPSAFPRPHARPRRPFSTFSGSYIHNNVFFFFFFGYLNNSVHRILKKSTQTPPFCFIARYLSDRSQPSQTPGLFQYLSSSELQNLLPSPIKRLITLCRWVGTEESGKFGSVGKGN